MITDCPLLDVNQLSIAQDVVYKASRRPAKVGEDIDITTKGG